MVKKSAEDLAVRLQKVHDEIISAAIKEYLDEYADYGWDNICSELANINAQIDLVVTELRYAQVKRDSYR